MAKERQNSHVRRTFAWREDGSTHTRTFHTFFAKGRVVI